MKLDDRKSLIDYLRRFFPEVDYNEISDEELYTMYLYIQLI